MLLHSLRCAQLPLDCQPLRPSLTVAASEILRPATATNLAYRQSQTLWLGIAAFGVIAVLLSKKVRGSIMLGEWVRNGLGNMYRALERGW